jgi:hypothetical protein
MLSAVPVATGAARSRSTDNRRNDQDIHIFPSQVSVASSIAGAKISAEEVHSLPGLYIEKKTKAVAKLEGHYILVSGENGRKK